MTLFRILFLLLFFSSCYAQKEVLLLHQSKINDLPLDPVYPRLIEEKDGVTQWKEQFQYLDSIDIYEIIYKSDDLRIKGFMVKPKQSGNYPCVIYNRGGNREFGALGVRQAALLMGSVAKAGYVVIASQYRGNGGSEGQEEFGGSDVNDVLILTDVLAEVENADTSRIGMYGWSRGGMMTYIALTKTDKIKTAIVGGAKSDLTIIDRPNMETNVYAELMPNYTENKMEELKKRSAIFWVDQFPKDVPILLLHGNADWRVKSTNSLRLALAFEEHRIPYRLKIFEGADHGISEFRAEVNQDVINWLDKYLKGDAPLPNMEFHGR